MDSTVVDPVGATTLTRPQQTFAIEANDQTRRIFGRWHRAHGDVHGVSEPREAQASWVVHRPRPVQQIVVRHADYYTQGRGLDRVEILLGSGVMVSEGDFWARQRRLLESAFRPKSLADFNGMIFHENCLLADRWQEMADAAQPVEVAAAISELTRVIVLKAIVGVDYARLVADGGNPFALLTEQPTRNLRFAAFFHRLKGVVDKIIDHRLNAEHHESDFLGHMLAARTRSGNAMTRRALTDEVMTLIIAGHETTASVLAIAWYLVATDESTRRRMQAEADALDEQVCSRSRADPRQDVPTLALADQVVAETLRLYPSGWLLSQRTGVDHELAGLPIVAGTRTTGSSQSASIRIAWPAATNRRIAWSIYRFLWAPALRRWASGDPAASFYTALPGRQRVGYRIGDQSAAGRRNVSTIDAQISISSRQRTRLWDCLKRWPTRSTRQPRPMARSASSMGPTTSAG